MASTEMKPRSIRLCATGILLSLCVFVFVPRTAGQTIEALHSFRGPDGVNPSSELVEGNDGNFYGTTFHGGVFHDYGTVFRMTPAGVFTNLNFFQDIEGSNPNAGLTRGSDGNFYGTTISGGVNGWGTVFRMTPTGSATTLVYVARSSGTLVEGTDGSFYGTTAQGGSNSKGTVFKVTPAGELTTLVSFAGTNGSTPLAGLVRGSDGNFYGTTYQGGTNGNWGTVFKMTPDGELTMLVSFNRTNGASPWARLVQGTNGVFYGTTFDGGALLYYGTVFKMTLDGALTTLVSFDGTNSSNPAGELVQGSDGNLYGTTGGTGDAIPHGNGTVFRMTPDGVLTTLVWLNRTNDGAYPTAGLVQGRDGNFYGTARYGGTNEEGTIFRIVMPVMLNVGVNANGIVLSWPTNALGFTLQLATNLNSPVAWMGFTNSPFTVGRQFTVTNTISGNAQFYRLAKP